MTLDHRHVAVGEKIELTATAHDGKGAPIPDVAVGRPTRPRADARRS